MPSTSEAAQEQAARQASLPHDMALALEDAVCY